MAYQGYHFFLGNIELPYAPSELKVTIGSKNKTVDLINGDEINILKAPKLTEIEFEIELPRGRQYAFANELRSPIRYTDMFEKLKLRKIVFDLVIVRNPPSGGLGTTLNGFASNSWKVCLEDYTLTESAENAYDITVALKFKEYVEYGTIKKVVENKVAPQTKPATQALSYVVKKGDCLWKISKKYYGTGTKWNIIYNANKFIIEHTARKYGKKSSSNGHWIYPGTKLLIPSANDSPRVDIR